MKLSKTALSLVLFCLLAPQPAKAGEVWAVFKGLIDIAHQLKLGIEITEFFVSDAKVGFHTYVRTNETLNDKNYTIEIVNYRNAIGYHIENLSPHNDGADSYIYHGGLLICSYQGYAYGYYHSDTGAGTSSAVGGVVDSSIDVTGSIGVAAGIVTDYNTSFTGGYRDNRFGRDHRLRCIRQSYSGEGYREQ